MKNILRESYDRSAEGYDDRFRALQVAKYEALLGSGDGLALGPLLRAGGRLLDLGCGTGLLAEWLGQRASDEGYAQARIVGVDLSAGMLERAGRRGMAVVQGDIEALPFAGASFACVCAFTAMRIIEGRPDAPALVEVARVLAPGGLLAVTVLERGYDRGFEQDLRAAGLRPGPLTRCGQDVGFLCARR